MGSPNTKYRPKLKAYNTHVSKIPNSRYTRKNEVWTWMRSSYFVYDRSANALICGKGVYKAYQIISCPPPCKIL